MQHDLVFHCVTGTRDRTIVVDFSDTTDFSDPAA